MRSHRGSSTLVVGLAATALGLVGCDRSSPRHPAIAAPVVAGLADRTLDARGRGLVLLRELGCVHCHAPSREDAESLDVRRGPNLAGVGSRLHLDYVRHFLEEPSLADPGTTMPAMLDAEDPTRRAADAAALTDYLRSIPSDPPLTAEDTTGALSPSDPEVVARGQRTFHRIGCVACHAPRDENGNESPLPGSLSLSNVASKYRPAALRDFLLDPESDRPNSRMPNLHLTPTEAHELTSYLLVGAPAEPTSGDAIDPLRVERGRAIFAERGCGACHALVDSTRPSPRAAKALRDLSGSSAGCLSDDEGPWPRYGLSQRQRDDLLAALSSLDAPTTDDQRIHRLLASRNCLACHARDDSPGIEKEKIEFFTSNDESVGQQSRIPPSLTLVGAKLQRDWLIDAIAHGQSVRPYLNTRMPGFGTAFATDLGDRLTNSDTLPPVSMPEYSGDAEKREATRNLGCELVGEKGMNCISCHSFAGERVGAVGALDLIDSTSLRLRREWFHQYLRSPTRFNPGTLMPEFFPGGVSQRPTIGDGDATTQIDAMWKYLAEGRNTKRPAGLRHAPIELVVHDEAVMLRRSAQNTGKRAIAVGYPGGINLTFDAESLALNQIWWGKFLDASGVWYGQGAGESRPLGDLLVHLPKGPSFVRLPSPDAPWPTASRRDLSDRWLGYDLDSKQQPTFRYMCSGITIEDTPSVMSEAATNAPPMLRRALRFLGDGPTSDARLDFLVARDSSIVEVRAGELAVGESLRIGLPAGSYRIKKADSTLELIVTIALEDGRADFTVDYRRNEKDH